MGREDEARFGIIVGVAVAEWMRSRESLVGKFLASSSGRHGVCPLRLGGILMMEPVSLLFLDIGPGSRIQS